MSSSQKQNSYTFLNKTITIHGTTLNQKELAAVLKESVRQMNYKGNILLNCELVVLKEHQSSPLIVYSLPPSQINNLFLCRITILKSNSCRCLKVLKPSAASSHNLKEGAMVSKQTNFNLNRTLPMNSALGNIYYFTRNYQQ